MSAYKWQREWPIRHSPRIWKLKSFIIIYLDDFGHDDADNPHDDLGTSGARDGRDGYFSELFLTKRFARRFVGTHPAKGYGYRSPPGEGGGKGGKPEPGRG